MHIQVLGQVRATVEGAPLDLGARKPRSIVAALAMTPGRPVAADTLADLVWGGSPPRAAHGALHAYLSGLRKALEPDRAAWGAGAVIETTDHGYVLRVDAHHVDAHAFADETRACDRLLAPLGSQLTGGTTAGWPNRGDVLATVDRLDAALAAWHGEPYADLPDHPTVTAERAALAQVRATAEEARLLGLLALGEPAGVLAVTEPATARQDLRERLWALHALALARSGRQADALDAVRRVRTLLADELGLDPGAEVRAVETAVLRQDETLHLVLPRARPAGAVAPDRPADEGPPVEQAPGADPTGADPTGDARGTAPVAVGAVGGATVVSVGRQVELVEVGRLLAQAAAGRLSVAQLVGEPGIGKSWLASAAIAAARGRGMTVAVGRCAGDDGAPPLWPWRSVLAGLAAAGPTVSGAATDTATDTEDRAAAFGAGHEAAGAGAAQRAFLVAESVRTALSRGTDRPTLVVLEDLHWADDASLRALAHVVGSLDEDLPLAILLTRRAHPEPTGALATVSEAVARRHGVRLDLDGLDPTASAELVRAIAGDDLPTALATSWHERAAGNPYFLVELARLGRQGDEDGVPASVRDVVARRMADLPERVIETLRTAAVVGRTFRLPTVAAAADLDADLAADDLEAALLAGLVRETGAEEYAFAHALTRETVYGSLSATRAARRHAQVARVLEQPGAVVLDDPDRLVAERARHWLAAGASHADRAWRAAREAADQARRLTSYREAMELRRAAVTALARATDADDHARFDLLLELATDAAHAALWPEVEAAAFEAISLGRSLGDPERVGVAAAAMTTYCVWTPHEVDQVFEDAVEDLRWALAHVADADHVTRSRLQLALAMELYYAPHSRAERHALVEAGMASAHASGRPDVVAWAASTAWLASWTPAQLAERERWTAIGLEALAGTSDRASEAVFWVRRALEALERGDRDTFEPALEQAETRSRALRLHYVTLTALWIRLSLAALRGQTDLVAGHLAELTEIAPLVAIPMQEAQAPAAATTAALFDPEQLAGVLPMLHDAQRQTGGMAVLVHLATARAGTPEDVRSWLADYPIPWEDDEYWSTLSDWSMEAEAAAVAGDVAVARHALEVLEPYAGGMTVAGAVLPLGPVDGFVALARHTVGDRAGAARAADAAERMAQTWGLSAYLTVLRGYRERWGF
ncbi:AAA family ATPase [Nocardioides sp. HDW12B]|uniref:BTAD domain-containing putative transcriptional regulator n=1 Tax=Nocardioides sp. HDW12B TaxID=2714939 RepID=UPI00140A6D13|nr:BTAD domain-containing putative transcriptional regulator [Nocardioides sp. HDW12B]QIK66725.1 AAA family ATPase [Nocardioides sp. HDW12B]